MDFHKEVRSLVVNYRVEFIQSCHFECRKQDH
jgi:hypothetical protein